MKSFDILQAPVQPGQQIRVQKGTWSISGPEKIERRDDFLQELEAAVKIITEVNKPQSEAPVELPPKLAAVLDKISSALGELDAESLKKLTDKIASLEELGLDGEMVSMLADEFGIDVSELLVVFWSVLSLTLAEHPEISEEQMVQFFESLANGEAPTGVLPISAEELKLIQSLLDVAKLAQVSQEKPQKLQALIKTLPEGVRDLIAGEADPVENVENEKLSSKTGIEISVGPVDENVEAKTEVKASGAPVVAETEVEASVAPVVAEKKTSEVAPKEPVAPEVVEKVRSRVLEAISRELDQAGEDGELPEDMEALRRRIDDLATRLKDLFVKTSTAGKTQASPLVAQGLLRAIPQPIRPTVSFQEQGVSLRDVSRRDLGQVYGQSQARVVFVLANDRVESLMVALEMNRPASQNVSKDGLKAVEGSIQNSNLVDILEHKTGSSEIQGKESVRLRYGSETVERLLQSAKDQLKLWVTRDFAAMKINIDPPELGRILLRTVVVDGRLGASIQTESLAAKEILMAHLHELKEVLKSREIELVHIEIDFKEKSDENRPEFQKKNRVGEFDMDDLLEGEGAAVDVPAASGLINLVA